MVLSTFLFATLAFAEPAPADPGDQAIEAALEGVYQQIPGMEDLDAEVSHGVVRLSGTVLESASRDDAVSIAKGWDGVVHVVDDVDLNTSVSDRLAPTLQASQDRLNGLVARLPLLVIAISIVALGWIVANAVRRAKSLFARVSDRPLVRNTVANLVRIGIVGAAILVALQLLDATALVGAILGTAGVFGLAVGFAFQDIVENYLAGILLSVQQPFSKDDSVEINGISGVVVKLTSRNTLILTFDGNHAYIPNATVFKGQVLNFSRNPHRRFQFDVGVGVEEDLAEVIETGVRTLRELQGVVHEPSPSLQVSQLGDSSVIVTVYGWVDQRSFSFQAVRTEAIRRIKEAFDDRGYDLPEPIYRVNIQQPAARPERRDHSARTQAPAVDLSPNTDVLRQAQAQRTDEDGQDLLADGDGTPRPG